MPIDPSNSASAMERFYRDRSITPTSAALAELVAGAMDFYARESASGLVADATADMLLFQFGVFDWGFDENFEIDLTRQFTAAGRLDDDAISQLHCTVYFEPTPTLRAIGRGNRWCRSRATLPIFKAFVLSSKAYLKALLHEPRRREIAWAPV